MNASDENKLMRRVQGYHNVRLDGIGDLVMRANGASVMDIGCNRGQVAYEFAMNGATTVHGCDIYEPGIKAAREWFTDLRLVSSRFEVCDLAKGLASLKPFGDQKYDIIVMLATYHKLKRIMGDKALSDLMQHFAQRTIKWFAWRGTSDKRNENEVEMRNLDRDLGASGLRRVHTSYLSMQLDLAAIWART